MNTPEPMVQEAEMQSLLVWQQEAGTPVLVERGFVYALLDLAGWGQGKGRIPEQMTQGDNSAALEGVLAAGTVNPNAGGGDAKPIQGKSCCYAWGWGQHLPELAEFGGWQLECSGSRQADV